MNGGNSAPIPPSSIIIPSRPVAAQPANPPPTPPTICTTNSGLSRRLGAAGEPLEASDPSPLPGRARLSGPDRATSTSPAVTSAPNARAHSTAVISVALGPAVEVEAALFDPLDHLGVAGTPQQRQGPAALAAPEDVVHLEAVAVGADHL